MTTSLCRCALAFGLIVGWFLPCSLTARAAGVLPACAQAFTNPPGVFIPGDYTQPQSALTWGDGVGLEAAVLGAYRLDAAQPLQPFLASIETLKCITLNWSFGAFTGAFSGDGSSVALQNSTRARVYDTRTGAQRFDASGAAAGTISLSRHGRFLLRENPASTVEAIDTAATAAPISLPAGCGSTRRDELPLRTSCKKLQSLELGSTDTDDRVEVTEHLLVSTDPFFPAIAGTAGVSVTMRRVWDLTDSALVSTEAAAVDQILRMPSGVRIGLKRGYRGEGLGFGTLTPLQNTPNAPAGWLAWQAWPFDATTDRLRSFRAEAIGVVDDERFWALLKAPRVDDPHMYNWVLTLWHAGRSAWLRDIFSMVMNRFRMQSSEGQRLILVEAPLIRKFSF